MVNEAVLGIKVMFTNVKQEMNKLKSSVSDTFKSQKDAFKTGQGLGMMAKEGVNVTKSMDMMRASLMGVNLKAFNAGLNTARRRFDMNTLSWLFGGMALKRLGMQMIRFIIPSMDMLAKLNTEGAKKVNAMTASIEFFKISLFETLSQTALFAKFVEWVVKGAIWMSKFAQTHPAVVAIATAIAGLAIVLGTLAIGISFFKQLGHMGVLLGLGQGTGLLGGIKKIGAALLGWVVSNPLLAAMAILAGLAIFAAIKFDNLRETLSGMWESSISTPFKNLLVSLFNLFDLTITSDEALEAMGSTFIWALTVPLGFINLVITGLMILVDWINIIGIQWQKATTSVRAFFSAVSGDWGGVKEAVDQWRALDREQKDYMVEASNRVEENKQGLEELGRIFNEGPLGSMRKEDFLTHAGEDTFGLSGVWGDGKLKVEEFKNEVSNVGGELDILKNELFNFKDDVLKNIGSENIEGSAANSFNTLGEGIETDTEFFRTLKAEIDSWVPSEKVIKVRYEYEGGPSFGDGKDDSETSSITGG